MYSDDAENPQWKVYKLGDGMTVTCRNHLLKHGQCYREICAIMGLKQDTEDFGKQIQRLPFTTEMFCYLLMKWVAVDDQVYHFYSTYPYLTFNGLGIPVFQCCRVS